MRFHLKKYRNNFIPKMKLYTTGKYEIINSGLQFYFKENNKKHQHFWKIIRS